MTNTRFCISTLLCICLTLSPSGKVRAEEWIDITDDYVTNPTFKNNDRTTGWEGTPFGAANPWENAEHYQTNFDSYQNITGLQPGRYRVSVDAFYRMGSAYNDYSLYSSGDYADYQYAKLYATTSEGNFQTSIAPISSAALKMSPGGGTTTVGGSGWGSGYYVPNNMEAAYYWFNAGYYDNSVEATVGSDGILRIGVRKSTTIQEDWMCLDNWKLEYYGEMAYISSIVLNPKATTLVSGE